MDELKPLEDMTDGGRNELTDYLAAIEQDGHAELADVLRRARDEYMSVSPLYINGKPSGLLEIRYSRRFESVRIGGDGDDYSMTLGDDYNYIYADAPIDEAELRTFSVDRESFNTAWEKTLEAGRTADEMDWSDVKVTLAPYIDKYGKPVLYTDMLFTVAVAAPVEDGDNERADHILDLLAAWDGSKKWLDARRGTGEDREAAKGTTYLRDKNVMIATDQITGSLFDRGREGYIEPAQYWSDEPKEIKSSRNGFVYLQLRLPTTTEITDDISTYELAARHDYWLGAAHKLVREGHTLITGEMILKKNGYDNPYSESMANTMRAAAEAMYQLTHMEIAVDTTNQYGKRKSGGMELNKRTTMRRIFGYEFSFTEWKRKDGTVVPSFELEYKGKGDPVSSCPLLEYQLEHKMFSDVPADDDCLAGLKLSLDHRIMWRYVRRRVLEERTTDRIRFDSMFTTLGMDGDSAPAKRKRRKMIDQLEKMLRRACRDDHDDTRRKRKVKHTRLFKSWRYLEDATGRYGVEIVPL